MINIEFGHIYTDQTIGPEHEAGAERACKVVSALKGGYCLVVWIDEYHPKVSNLIITDYLDFLDSKDVLPHYVVFEGDLKPLAYRLLYSIPQKQRKDLCKWIDGKEKMPCSLLTATWYLARLGAFKEEFKKVAIGAHTIPFCGDEILTVLPESYKANENRALELIQASPWAHLVGRIGFEWI